MEHFVQFAINIDDKTIQKRIENNAYDDICKTLVDEAHEALASKRYGYNSQEPDWEKLISPHLEKLVEDNKDKIIDLAAEKLKESFTRTKYYREKMKEAI